MAEGTYQKILATVGVTSSPPGSDFLTWLIERKAPQGIVDLLAPGVPLRRKGRVQDRWEFFSAMDIQKEVEEFPRYLKSGLLALGTCLNGDPIALDLRKQVGAVGYISHEEVWGDDEARIRKHFVLVASSLAEFARGVCDRSLPIDYYEAKSRK